MTTSPKRILVFPGTSLVGLEILNSLRSLPGLIVHGAGTDVPAGREAGFAEFDYLPHIDNKNFEHELRALVYRTTIDYVYPANDIAISVLSEIDLAGPVLVSHPPETVRVAGSKIATHITFAEDHITPRRYFSEPRDTLFPIFAKPDVSHSSIGAVTIGDKSALDKLVGSVDNFWDTYLVTELLTADEVTVDCLSTTDQGLVYAAPRTRDVARGGVSVVTTDYHDTALDNMARLINGRLTFNGPWFFQAKRNVGGEFRLLEIGARLAGASGIRRAQGVNLAQLAILASDSMTLSVYETAFDFTSRRVNATPEVESKELFTALYVDLDDTLILNRSVNEPVERLARYVKSLGFYVAVITRHSLDPVATLEYFGLAGLFDDIFHITNKESKSSYISAGRNSVLIDDSFSERLSCNSRTDILAVDASSATQLRRLFNGDK